MSTAIRRYTFKMYPNATQAAALEARRLMACELYNALLWQRRDAWDRRRKSLTRFDQGREMTKLRHQLPEWADFPATVMERVAERVDQAWKKAWDNAKKEKKPFWAPSYQRRDDFSGFGCREMPKGWRWLDGKRIRLQGIGDIKVRGRFPCEPLDCRTADVMKRAGVWFISIVVKIDENWLMRSRTPPVFTRAVSKLLSNINRVATISSGHPSFEGGAQARSCAVSRGSRSGNPSFEGCAQGDEQLRKPLNGSGHPSFEGGAQEAHRRTRNGQGSGHPSFEGCAQAGKLPMADAARGTLRLKGIRRQQCNRPARGRKNAERRRRNKIAQRDHALHQYTTFIAEHGGDVIVEVPPLVKATASARGTKKEPGAMVKWKAGHNRELLDHGIGKMCEMLAYKVEGRGNKFQKVEVETHDAMVPVAVVALAKVSKRATKIASKAKADARPDAVSQRAVVEYPNKLRGLKVGLSRTP